jgi:SAM-dependent methyltransferase
VSNPLVHVQAQVLVLVHVHVHVLVLVLGGACGGAQPQPQSQPQPGEHAGSHDHHGGMPHRFEHAEDWVAAFDDPARDAWQKPEQVLAALALSPEMIVADVGAGTGYFTVRLARALPRGQVIATDIEPDMVRYLGERAAREHLANVRAQLSGPDVARLDPASVDRILIVDVWHHIADRPRYAASLAAALRPGGRVAIVDFTQSATHGPPKHHRLPAASIVADLRTAGLDAALAATELPEQYIVVATKR